MTRIGEETLVSSSHEGDKAEGAGQSPGPTPGLPPLQEHVRHAWCLGTDRPSHGSGRSQPMCWLSLGTGFLIPS